jgi:ATPases of the AAA+ class
MSSKKMETDERGRVGTFVEQAEIYHDGTAIMLPRDMSLEAGISNLQRLLQYENEWTEFSVNIECFAQDGAVALSRVLAKRYGWARAVPTPGFFGDDPPRMLEVEVGVNETMSVPWGRFVLPGIKGYVSTSIGNIKGRRVFTLSAEILRKHEGEVRAIAELVREEVRKNSIYRGKAIKVSFGQTRGGWDCEITFMDVSGINEDSLIYSKHVKDSILTNLITPLEHRAELAKYGVPFKRGVLLAGTYGVGKTLAMLLAAKKATDNGITFVHLEQAKDFADGVLLGRQYGPAVVACEDIDRVTSGMRGASLDEILNVVDGIDSKSAELMVLLTTNNVDLIHQGMLRPGRLDAVIKVEPPDAEAVGLLIRLYGRGLVSDSADLRKVGKLLAGQIPAVVREVVERAKLAAIRLGTFNAHGKLMITDDALVDSANTMRMQIELLTRDPQRDPTQLEMFGNAIGNTLVKGLQVALSVEKDAYVFESDSDGDLTMGTNESYLDQALENGYEDAEGINYGRLVGKVEALPNGALEAMGAV